MAHAAARALNGRLSLRAAVRDQRTVLLEAQGSYPLQVLRPHLVPADGSLSLVLLLLCGGLLDGDEADIRLTLEPGARLALRTQAATQLHAGRSRQTLEVSVGEDAWFSYVPHCSVPHAGAEFESRTRIQMQPGARVLVADALAPGRIQHGERFAYRHLRLDLNVCCQTRVLARERAVIRPDPALLGAQFGPATHTAGAYLLGPGQPPVVEACGTARTGVTRLAHGGWHVRTLASRAADVDAALLQLHAQWWGSAVSPAASGRPSHTPGSS